MDEDALRRHVQFQIENGIHGLCSPVTGGEFASLSAEEKRRVVEIVAEETGSRTPFFAGVSSTNLNETLSLTKHAMDVGATGIFVMTPYFYKYTPQETYEYIKRTAEAANCDVMVYNSTYTGTPLDPVAIEKLSEIDNVVALKEGNQLQVPEDIRRTRGKLAVFSARDVYFFETLAWGGAGAVSFASNIFPKHLVLIFDAFKKGNLNTAREIQYDLLPLIWGLVSRSFPAPTKAALEIIGRPVGPVRQPLTMLNNEEKAELKRLINALPPAEKYRV